MHGWKKVFRLQCNDGGSMVGKLFDRWGLKFDRGAAAGTDGWSLGG